MRLYAVAAEHDWALALHVGAGGRVEELAVQGPGDYEKGLTDAYARGDALLAAGAPAFEAVCAVVVQSLEGNPLFNAGRGAALTHEGTIEHGAAVMTGTVGLVRWLSLAGPAIRCSPRSKSWKKTSACSTRVCLERRWRLGALRRPDRNTSARPAVRSSCGTPEQRCPRPAARYRRRGGA